MRVGVEGNLYLAWPSRFDTTWTGSPAWSNNVAQVWRIPWNVIRLTFASFPSRVNCRSPRLFTCAIRGRLPLEQSVDVQIRRSRARRRRRLTASLAAARSRSPPTERGSGHACLRRPCPFSFSDRRPARGLCSSHRFRTGPEGARLTPTHPDARAALPTAGARYIAPSPSVVLGPPLVLLELHVEIQPVPHVDEPPAAAGGNRRAASAILERSGTRDTGSGRCACRRCASAGPASKAWRRLDVHAASETVRKKRPRSALPRSTRRATSQEMMAPGR